MGNYNSCVSREKPEELQNLEQRRNPVDDIQIDPDNFQQIEIVMKRTIEINKFDKIMRKQELLRKLKDNRD